MLLWPWPREISGSLGGGAGPVSKLRLLGDSHHTTRIAFVEFHEADSARTALTCSGALLGETSQKPVTHCCSGQLQPLRNMLDFPTSCAPCSQDYAVQPVACRCMHELIEEMNSAASNSP